LALRFLLFFALTYLFFSLLRRFLSWRRQERNLRRHAEATLGEEMVLDPQCQSYLPKGSALLRGGFYFCSEQCARLYLDSTQDSKS
jgi:YHS domain-containing protein